MVANRVREPAAQDDGGRRELLRGGDARLRLVGAPAARPAGSIGTPKPHPRIPSFFRIELSGAEGDRTPDLMTASHALSQLSYGPKIFAVEVRPATCEQS